MKRVGSKSVAAEVFGHAIGAVFGFDENNHRPCAFMQLGLKLLVFLRLFDADGFLFDLGGDDVGCTH